MNTNEIYCGDSLSLIPQLDLKSNLIILHPPDLSDTGHTIDEYLGFLRCVYLECWSKLDDNGMLVSINTDRKMKGIFAKHHEIMKIMDGKHLINYKIWAKSLKGNLFIPTFAHCLFYAKGQTTNNRQLDFMPDVWLIPQEKVRNYPGKDNFPYALIERILKNHSKEGDLVLDPFAGSGTTLVCAQNLKRLYVGFELNPAFVSLTKSRLQIY